MSAQTTTRGDKMRLSRRTNIVLPILSLVLIGSVATLLIRYRNATDVSRQIVRVQFGWVPDAHHAGFWVAMEKGFYKDEGLAVELRPGGIGSSPISAVVSGAAEVGQISGVEQLISARAEGLPVRAIGAFHRTSPHALISTDR